MAEKDELKDKQKKAKPKQKTLINYSESGGKGQVRILSVDKKGKIIRIDNADKDAEEGIALKELKKFVNAL